MWCGTPHTSASHDHPLPHSLPSEKEDLHISFPMLAGRFSPDHTGPAWAGVSQLEEYPPTSLSLGNLNECTVPGIPMDTHSGGPFLHSYTTQCPVPTLPCICILSLSSHRVLGRGVPGPACRSDS